MEKPIIQFRDYGFQYHAQSEATLKDISLEIRQGEKILIVDPSGSGKSTLANCMNGLCPHSYSGEITGSLVVGGKEAKDEGIFSLSAMIGTVLQDPDGQFIGLTVGKTSLFRWRTTGSHRRKWNQE